MRGHAVSFWKMERWILGGFAVRRSEGGEGDSG